MNGSRLSPKIWGKSVLESLKQMPNFTVAAKKAGVSYQALNKYRERHPEFNRECLLAVEQGVQLLEAHCWKRATTGWTRPIFQRNSKGDPVQVGEEPLYDGRLAEMLLRAHAPQKYNPKIQQEITGPGGVPLSAPVIQPQVFFCLPPNNRGDLAHASDPPAHEAPAQITEIQSVADGSKKAFENGP
jgi:hypothetical protein